MNDQPNICHVKADHIQPCESLSEAIDSIYARPARLRLVQLAEMSTGKLTRNMLVLKTGEHRKKGVVVNHCPFCGEHISYHLTGDKRLTITEAAA